MATRTKPPQFSARLWDWLTEPHASLVNDEDRYQARMLAAIPLPLVVALPLLYLVRQSGFTTMGRSTEVFAILVLLSALFAYIASRTPYYKWGVVVLVAGIMTFVFGVVVSDRTPTAFQVMTLYLVPAVFIVSLFFEVLPTFIVSILTIVALVFVSRIVPDSDGGLLTNQLRFLSVMVVLIVGETYVRQRHRYRLEQREQSLIESESRYRSLFEATLEPLLIHRDGIVVDANRAFEEIMGYRIDDLRGQAIFVLIHPDARAQVRQVDNSAMEQRYEMKCLRKDGSSFLAEVFTKTHVYQNQQVRVVTFRDLTIQHEAETQRFEIAMQGEMQQVQQRLIRHLSHDFRTPLSVIKTSLYLLERTLNDPARHHHHVEVLRLQAERLQEMMDDFITLARLDHVSKHDLDESAIDLDAFLRGIHSEYLEAAAKKEQIFTYHPPPLPLVPEIKLDEDSLRRVIKSLLVNAFAYTPEGGSIKLQVEGNLTEVQLIVSDTGVGIAADDLPHIFDHFYRSDPARGTDNGGAGLGLTIAHKLVEIMGGVLEVQSEVGLGSSFTVRLPLQRQAEMQQAKIVPEPGA